MDVICNVIPIINKNILFCFCENEKKMKIKIPKRNFHIFFKSSEEYENWKIVF